MTYGKEAQPLRQRYPFLEMENGQFLSFLLLPV